MRRPAASRTHKLREPAADIEGTPRLRNQRTGVPDTGPAAATSARHPGGRSAHGTARRGGRPRPPETSLGVPEPEDGLDDGAGANAEPAGDLDVRGSQVPQLLGFGGDPLVRWPGFRPTEVGENREFGQGARRLRSGPPTQKVANHRPSPPRTRTPPAAPARRAPRPVRPSCRAAGRSRRTRPSPRTWTAPVRRSRRAAGRSPPGAFPGPVDEQRDVPVRLPRNRAPAASPCG